MSIEYKSNIKDVLARTLSVPEMHAKLLKGMNRGGAQFTGWIQETQLSGRPGLNVGGNRLRASFTYKTQDSPTNITTTMGTNVFYAIVHQKGKTIYPKTAKALCFSITMDCNTATLVFKSIMFESVHACNAKHAPTQTDKKNVGIFILFFPRYVQQQQIK